MKYCLMCGMIYAESYDEYENQTCFGCGFQLIEDNDMTEEQFLQLSESEKDDYELKIYNICKQSEFFDEDLYNERREEMDDWYFTFRFDKYEQLTGEKAWTKENKLYHEMEAQKEVSEAMAKYAGTISSSSNTPKCPICQSTNLSKISSVKKAAKGGLFGIFGAGDIGKTNKCNNCGSRF